MDHDEVLTDFDRQMRREARPDGPGARVERVGAVVRHVAPAHGWNGVLWSGLDQADVDAEIAEQVRYFTSIGREFEWKLYSHDRPGDLAGRLRAAGFVPEPEEALLVARVDELPTDVELPPGVRLVPVTDQAGVDLVAAVHERVFGSEAARFRQQMLDQLAGQPDTVEIVLAMAGDEPVSAARLEMIPGTAFAGLWGGGTLASWRGRGIYRALIAYRARIAAERGYRYLQVDASDQSSPILQRLGFARLGTTTPYVYRP
ncbi:GNAT family N-acetyltransferase [Kitasatospora sp. NPDC057223]|uniref:GNAT family N-acetyltransferase n=1 Tax=Kitasatospora sp. NPDC057223 TaxID=3346055 RepID=UPI0036347C9B